MVRFATLEDIEALDMIEAHCFDTDMITKGQFKIMIETQGADVLVATNGGVGGTAIPMVIGYIITLNRKGFCRIYSCAVAPEYRRLAIGKSLVMQAEIKARIKGHWLMRAEVRKDNIGAQEFWKREGYTIYGHIPRYYQDKMDALLIEKVIDNGTAKGMQKEKPPAGSKPLVPEREPA